jgi:hypothetical protein
VTDEPRGGPPGPPPPPGSPTLPPAAPPPWPGSQPPTRGGVAPGGYPPAWGQAPTGGPVTWDTPRTDNSGCLKACLIVGLIGLALVVVGIVAAVILGGRIVSEIAEDPDAFFGGPCPIADSFAVSEAVGQPVELFALEGFMGGTMDALLDRRLLPDAPDCYAIGDDGFVARIAVDPTGGIQAFDEARDLAEASFLERDLPGVGDEAFCTSVSATGSSGVLVRWGDQVAYVSIADDNTFNPSSRCDLALAIADALEP